MTTLVYRAGVLAADTRGTVGGWVQPGRTIKVHRTKRGRLIGFVGTVSEASAFLRWATGGGAEKDRPALDEATCVIVEPDGAIIVHETSGWFRAEAAEFHAWGSGMPTALGALYMGATAVQAVEIAAKLDP